MGISKEIKAYYWDKYSYNGKMPEMFARGWTEVQASAVDAGNAVDQAYRQVEYFGKVASRAGNEAAVYSNRLDDAIDAAAEFSSETDGATDALDAQAQAANEATSAIWDIVKGKRDFASVPEVIKPKVREVLIDLELEDLIVE